MGENERLLSETFWQMVERSTLGTCPVDDSSGQSAELSTTSKSRAIDLYCWWAGVTGFRTAVPSLGSFPEFISFIAQGNLAAFEAWVLLNSKFKIDIPKGYTNRDSSRTPSSYFTFSLPTPARKSRPITRSDLPVSIAPDDVDDDALSVALGAVLTCASLVRVQMGNPIGRSPVDATSSDSTYLAESAALPDERKRIAVVIGAIDDGAPFAHAALRTGDATSTRVVALWSQSRQTNVLSPGRWQDFRGQWYGAMMGPIELARAIEAGVHEGEVDELRCYTNLFKKTERRRTLHRRESHGAAVINALAGSLDAAHVISSDPDIESGLPGRMHELHDAASSAPVIMVDLPWEVTTISSGRWMPPSALDGVRFIVDQARKRYIATDSKDVPVVINISSGSSAGAHDGKSMFESALADILQKDARLAITIAAGNSRLARAHAEIVINPGDSGEICVRAVPGKPFETYTEFWPEWLGAAPEPTPGANDADRFSSVKFSVVAPTGERTREVEAGDGEALLLDINKKTIAGLKFAKNAVQSVNRAMALLVLSPTAIHEWRPSAPSGNWVVRCRNDGMRPLVLRAWIERDEVVFGIRQPQLAHFVHNGIGDQPIRDWQDDTQGGKSSDGPQKLLNPISRYDTTSNFANAPHAFAVAAGTRGRLTGYVSPYSGGGSRDSEYTRPVMISQADRSPAQPGIPVFGAYGAARYHMNGTSISAPRAARWIANYMAKGHDRPSVEILARCSVAREHPHLVDPVTGKKQTAAGEGNWFVDPTDGSMELCLGKPR